MDAFVLAGTVAVDAGDDVVVVVILVVVVVVVVVGSRRISIEIGSIATV